MKHKLSALVVITIASCITACTAKADYVPDANFGNVYEIESAPNFEETKIIANTGSEELEAQKKEEIESECLGIFNVTAYCSCKKCCGKWSPEVTGKKSWTASGTHPKAKRTVAVDKNVIPLGTKVIIDGHEYIAEDTGSGVNGNHIDIYFDSHKEAKDFGSQKKEVFICQ